MLRFVTVEPTYELVLSDVEAEDDDKIAEMLSENIKTMYKVYAVTINNEIETYVNTVEEAETIVAEMQSEYSEDVAKVGIQEQYTTDFESVGTQSLEVAKLSVDTDLRGIKTEQERIAEATFNGVYFSVKPVVGNITSRYGVVETSVRNHAHGGLDIAAPYGTSIKAAADGTVSYFPDRNAISTFSLPLCLFQNDLPYFLRQNSSNCHLPHFLHSWQLSLPYLQSKILIPFSEYFPANHPY